MNTPHQPEVITRGRLDPPLMLGPERLHYQYAVTVPQLHLTLTSVLQGLAFGVLLLNIPLPSSTERQHIVIWLSQHYFLIPYLVSCMMIIFIWMQFVSTSLFLIWPVSTVQAILMFLLALTEVTTFRAMSSIPAWLVGSGAITCVGGVIYLNNLRLRTQDDFQGKEAAKAETRSNTLSGLGYVGLGIGIMALGLAQSHMAQSLVGFIYLSGKGLTWSELLVLLLLMIILMGWDAANRQYVLRQIAKDSDLTVLPHGKIRYREPNDS